MKIPEADRNDETESIGMPVTNAVVHVPGQSVIPIPIMIPPIIARGSNRGFGHSQAKLAAGLRPQKRTDNYAEIDDKGVKKEIVARLFIELPDHGQKTAAADPELRHHGEHQHVQRGEPSREQQRLLD